MRWSAATGMMLQSVIGMMGGGFDPDAIAYFNQLTVQPSMAYKSAVNTLVKQLKSDGNWSLIDRLWIHATEIQQHSKVSLVNPTSTQISEIGTPPWTINQGYTATSGNALNSNFTGGNIGENYQLNSASAFAYCITSPGSGYIGGAFTGSVTNVFVFTGSAFVINSGNTELIYVLTGSPGLIHGKRTSSTSVEVFQKGVSKATRSVSTTGIFGPKYFLGARFGTSLFGSGAGHKQAISGFGSGLINESTFNSAIQTFATSIGFNV